uniref:Angiotensin-converting enzyme n=1 Tax=Timema douglasi TaxID=61478 RepID=A0A7R8ZEN0_TIMDO|nr:unnamed protein product [Timema douglasi]
MCTVERTFSALRRLKKDLRKSYGRKRLTSGPEDARTNLPVNWATSDAGYADMGEVWREELETPELEKVIEKLYQMVEPLYMHLHAFVRHKLVQYYGEEIVKPTGTIPAHLLAPPGLFYHVLGQHRTVQPDNTLRHDFPPSYPLYLPLGILWFHL